MREEGDKSVTRENRFKFLRRQLWRAPFLLGQHAGMIMPPFVFSSPSIRRMTTRSCNERNFMSFAPGLACDGGLGPDALRSERVSSPT